MINKIIHGCLWIWNFSSLVQLDISLVRGAHSLAIKWNTRIEIPYLRAPCIIHHIFYVWGIITAIHTIRLSWKYCFTSRCFWLASTSLTFLDVRPQVSVLEGTPPRRLTLFSRKDLHQVPSRFLAAYWDLSFRSHIYRAWGPFQGWCPDITFFCQMRRFYEGGAYWIFFSNAVHTPRRCLSCTIS